MTPERTRRMQPGAAVVVRKRLELHAEVAAVSEQKFVVLRDARRAGIEIQSFAGIELAGLRRADLVDDVTGAQRQHPATRRGARFEERAGVTETRHLDRRGHAGDAGAQDDDGLSGAYVLRPVTGPRRGQARRRRRCPRSGCCRRRAASRNRRADAQCRHRPQHRRTAGGSANGGEEFPSRHTTVFVRHVVPRATDTG